ncbi:MAG: substrate-binding domain-containing protein [Bryobacteraceae bacterium]
MNKQMCLAWTAALVLLPRIAPAQPGFGENLKIYAAAVVKTPLTAIAAEYERSSGNSVTLIFDTAGAAAQRFQADPEASLLITTVPLLRNGEGSGALKDGGSIALGSTVAGVAVPPQFAKPDVSSPEKLKAALLAARRIAVSDPARGATVGTHLMKVIEALGIKEQLQPKITFASDGVATMRLVLDGSVDIGVSQSSEIVQASPDSMAGPFPQEFALETEFSVWHRRNASSAVKDLVAAITGAAGRQKLAADGLIPAAK